MIDAEARISRSPRYFSPTARTGISCPGRQFRVDRLDAYVIQNSRDPIPLTRLGGDTDSRVDFTAAQRLIQFDHELAETRDLFDHHDSRVYGDYLDAHPEMSADAIAFRAFLADQERVRLGGSGVIVLEGPHSAGPASQRARAVQR